MELSFRQATLDDVESTFAIKKAAFRPYVELVYGWDEDDQWQRHKAEFSCETVRLILRDGKDVGYVLVRRLADALYLSQIFILPAHQGQGIGVKCMGLIQEEARLQGLPLRLQVFKANPRAQAFYTRLGFQPVSESATHVQFSSSP